MPDKIEPEEPEDNEADELDAAIEAGDFDHIFASSPDWIDDE